MVRPGHVNPFPSNPVLSPMYHCKPGTERAQYCGGGTISPYPVSKSMERLPTPVVWSKWSPLGEALVSGFNVCCARHMAFGEAMPLERLAQAGRRGGKRV